MLEHVLQFAVALFIGLLLIAVIGLIFYWVDRP